MLQYIVICVFCVIYVAIYCYLCIMCFLCYNILLSVYYPDFIFHSLSDQEKKLSILLFLKIDYINIFSSWCGKFSFFDSSEAEFLYSRDKNQKKRQNSFIWQKPYYLIFLFYSTKHCKGQKIIMSFVLQCTVSGR